MVFPAVMYGCESWTIKKAERQRIDAFELWCWRRLLRVPWTARRSNQSIPKEISPEYSLEGMMLKLKLQNFGHLMQRTDSSWCWERLKVGGEGDDRGWDGWMTSLTQWTWVWVNSGSWWWTERPGVLQSMGSQRVRHNWATELKDPYPYKQVLKWSVSCSVMSDSLRPHRLKPTRFPCPWDSLGKNTGVAGHFLRKGIFSTQGLKLCLLHCRQILYHLSQCKEGSPLASTRTAHLCLMGHDDCHQTELPCFR